MWVTTKSPVTVCVTTATDASDGEIGVGMIGVAPPVDWTRVTLAELTGFPDDTGAMVTLDGEFEVVSTVDSDSVD